LNIPTIKPTSVFLETLKGHQQAIPPVWFMRQAGRYLPEYRALRAKAGSFLDLCYNSDFACEVTLQPIRRYDLDAAILFADILLLPHALGQDLSFVEGEGPRLRPLMTNMMIESFRNRDIHETLSPIYDSVSKIRAALAPEKALIGFAGAPWTVATYMLAGGPIKDPSSLRGLYYSDREFLLGLIDLLSLRTVEYLSRQIEAGADAIQLFDSWAGGLPPIILREVSITPLQKIAGALKQAYPDIPIILFPKDVGAQAIDYAKLSECDAISIDPSTPWDWARTYLSPHCVVQGGLDPLMVVRGGETMKNAARNLMADFEDVPYIFNLGHGFVPQTPPEHVTELMKVIRD